MIADSIESILHCFDILLLPLALLAKFFDFASQLFLNEPVCLYSLYLSLELVFLRAYAALLGALSLNGLLVLSNQSLPVTFVVLPFLLQSLLELLQFCLTPLAVVLQLCNLMVHFLVLHG